MEDTISSKPRNFKSLAELHRRLVCFCRLTEVLDLTRREKKSGAHQRGIFLFNDIMVVTKSIVGKKKTVHQFRSILNLTDLRVNVFSTNEYGFGIQLQDRLSGKTVATFNARSQSDQGRFVNDLQEAVAECVEMEKGKMFLNRREHLEQEEESFC